MKSRSVNLGFTHLIPGTSFAVVLCCAVNLPPRTSALCPQARPGYRYRRSPQRAVSLVTRPFSRLLPNFRRYGDSFRTSAGDAGNQFYTDLREVFGKFTVSKPCHLRAEVFLISDATTSGATRNRSRSCVSESSGPSIGTWYRARTRPTSLGFPVKKSQPGASAPSFFA